MRLMCERLPGIVAVRDSKDPDGPTLIFTPGRGGSRAACQYRAGSQVHQAGAQAAAASTRSVFVTDSSLSQALIAPANPCAANCAMT